MFTSTHPFPPFDVLRVPYTTAPGADGARVGRISAVDTAGDANPPRQLLWARTHRRSTVRRYRGRFRVAGIEVAGVVDDVRPEHLGLRVDVPWTAEPVVAPDGRQVAAVWSSAAGDVLLPFDPGAVMTTLWSEAYTRLGARASLRRSARKLLVAGYYVLRPAIPRRMQLGLRRRIARGQRPVDFPGWPLEQGLHDLYAWLLRLASGIAGAPVPWLHPWPDGHEWAMVLTHDVETYDGYTTMDRLRGPERVHGYRSSWNFVPERYDVDLGVVEEIRAEGCEVGVHGLRHDGKDLGSRRLLERRLPGMHEAARRWGAVGFRSPATQRAWDLMPRLRFAYDSSYTDTDPYEPQPGGCCTYWPFFNDELVELPITLPQDHTLFEILGHRDGSVWVEKAAELRRRHGMVLVLSHPDYARGPAAQAWEALLEEFAGDRTKWQPLPLDVAEWWRARAESRPRWHDGDWRVVGPASGRARVCLAGGET